MSYLRRITLCFCLLTGFASAAHGTTPNSDPTVGTWTGSATYGDESFPYGLEILSGRSGLQFIYYEPAVRFDFIGPIPLSKDGDTYKGDPVTLTLSQDQDSLSGLMSFDGHDVKLVLKRGPLPAMPATQVPYAPVAQPLWTFKTDGAVWSAPVVADGTVYFGSYDGNVYALNAADGKEVWRFKTGGAVMGRPTVDGQYLYVPSDDGMLYKLARKDASAVWKFDTHGGAVVRGMPHEFSPEFDIFQSSATVAGGTVYIGSADKRLYAVDAGSGQERWHFDTQGIIRSTPRVADGRVFFGSNDNNLYAVDAVKGTLLWKLDAREPLPVEPLVVDGNVYLGSESSDIFAIDAATGTIKWKKFMWGSYVESSARMRDGVLYIGSSDYQLLFALDPKDGHEIWRFDTGGWAWPTPAVTDQQVFTGASSGMVYPIQHKAGAFYAVDRASGKVQWRYPVGRVKDAFIYGVTSSPAVDGDRVFFGGMDGVFYGFRTDGTAP